MPHRLLWNGTWDDYSTEDVASPNLLSPAAGAGIGNSQNPGNFGQGIGPSPIPGSPVYFAQGGATHITTSAAQASSVLVTNGGMTFDLQFDSASMANTAAAAAFRAGVEQAASMLSAVITDKITVNIAITYSGTGGGAAAGPSGYYENYSAIASDLISHASPGDTIFNSLPTGPSIQGQSSIAVWDAELKVWGLLGANDLTTADGSAIFSTDISSNALVGVALHELTHALGRVPFGPAPDIFDLFRFTSAGTALFSGSIPAPAAYFSINGGITKLADYGRTSDPSDFLNSGVQGTTDPFNEYYIPGSTLQNLTTVDLLQLDALGFHLASSTSAAPVVNIGAPQTLWQNVSNNVTGISITDASAGSSTINVEVKDLQGLLSVTPASGLSVTGDHSIDLKMSGTLAAVNTALGTLHDINSVIGTDKLTISMSDLGTGLTAVGTESISVQALTANVSGRGTVSNPLVLTGYSTGDSITINDATGFVSAAVTDANVISSGASIYTLSGWVKGALSTLGDGLPSHDIGWFVFGGNTYLVEQAHATGTNFTNNSPRDTLVELVGIHDESSAILSGHTLILA